MRQEAANLGNKSTGKDALHFHSGKQTGNTLLRQGAFILPRIAPVAQNDARAADAHHFLGNGLAKSFVRELHEHRGFHNDVKKGIGKIECGGITTGDMTQGQPLFGLLNSLVKDVDAVQSIRPKAHFEQGQKRVSAPAANVKHATAGRIWTASKRPNDGRFHGERLKQHLGVADDVIS